ncbi:VCBS domain-containing protein, partial [Aureimonas psammosilenae]|uniref:VCBS domain-containing protein n=1 Tax=Aureimonas psammosilenae TaxID=2495496 RepID=UPI001AEE7982
LVAGVQSADLVEGTAGSIGVDRATIALTASDADTGDALSFEAAGWTADGTGHLVKAGLYGTAKLDVASGVVSYALDNALAATDALAGGQRAVDGFEVGVRDGSGALATTRFGFAVVGADDGKTITGTSGNDYISPTGTVAGQAKATPFSDVIFGLAGNDVLDGGAGADRLVGGTGDDIYYVDNAGDLVVENPDEGNDIVMSSLSWTLQDQIEKLTLLGMAAINGTGNALANRLVGNAGANILVGLAGSDTLDGMGGADRMVGGTGDDTYYVDDAGDVAIEGVNEGYDTVNSTISLTLADNLERLTLTGTAAIDGTGNVLANKLVGNAGANILIGLAGNDTLDGMGGADRMVGGVGDDIYYVDNAGDAVVEAANEGTDTVNASIAFVLGDGVENLTLTGTAAINGSGNGSSNWLVGNSADNILKGFGGNDFLNGGDGTDQLMGGQGDDTYYVDNAVDTVVEAVNEGYDTVNASVTLTLSDNVERLTLTGTAAIDGTGNALANRLVGNGASNVLIGLGGSDFLDGGAGADRLVGGIGDDTYTVDNLGDTVVELAGEGTDTVNTSVTWTLGSNVENLSLTGTGAIDGTGNALANRIFGNAANNILNGGAGNDTLGGGGGADVFVFNTAISGGQNVDTLTDFSPKDDVFWLDSSVFKGLAAGALQSTAFAIGPSASNAAQTIIYDQTNGKLFYDADGIGGAAQIQFAKIDANLDLNAGNFFIL